MTAIESDIVGIGLGSIHRNNGKLGGHGFFGTC